MLRVEPVEGSTSAEDDDSGCGTTAYLPVSVEAGQRLRISVAAECVHPTATIRLHQVAAVETPETKRAALDAREALARVQAHFESNRRKEAGQELEAGLVALLGATGAETSEECAQAASMFVEWASRLFKVRKQREALEFALRHRERCLPATHFGIHYFRFALGATYQAFQDLERARELMQPALEYVLACAPAESPEPYRLAITYAALLKFTGDLAGAAQHFGVGAQGLLPLLGPEDDTVVAARFELSNVLGELGDVWTALLLMEDVDAINRRTLAADNPRRFISRTNLAGCLMDVGDLARAREVLEQCLTSPAGESIPHNMLAVSSENLAILYMREGEFEQAAEWFAKALTMLDDSVPAGPLERARLEANAAMANLELGQLQSAEEMIEHSMATYEQFLPANSLERAIVRQNFATVLAAAGKAERALQFMEDVVADLDREANERNPEYWRILDNTAWLHARNGNVGRAAETMYEAMDGPTRVVSDWVVGMSARELEQRVMACSWLVSSGISFALDAGAQSWSTELTNRVFRCVETLRNAVLLYAALDRSLQGDAEVQKLKRDVARASAKLAKLAHDEASEEAIADARGTRDRLQRALTARALERAEQGKVPVDIRAPAAVIQPAMNEALVSYHRFERRPAFWPTGDSRRVEPGVCAFVVRPGVSPEIVDLGAAGEIENLVMTWRDALTGETPESSGRGVGMELRQRVVDSVIGVLGAADASIDRLIVVPDDVLCLLPFDCLPLDNGLLGERLSISTRLTAFESRLDASESKPPAGLLAVGGVAFDGEVGLHVERSTELVDGVPVESAVSRSSTAATWVSTRLRGTSMERGFAELPYSAEEVRGIAAIYDGAFPGGPQAMVVGNAAATRDAVRDLAEQAGFVHLATHGWGAPSRSLRSASQYPSVARAADPRIISPMLMCGLALAGANRPSDPAGQVLGIVTGEELAAWDLSGCDLAVLSACDTNVGVYHPGQGVASLQKALHMAGARQAVTSLWKVPDSATQELMLDFYRRLWVEKKSPSVALWEAKLARRAMRRPANEWAGWVLTVRSD
jgi:CHAT domain-containing protein/tetratricopeptide (TPR) repeat protein